MNPPDIEPGPDHPIAIMPLGKQVIVRFGKKTIADSEHALLLDEKDHPPVLYVPRADVAMRHFERTEKTTHCPYKGDAVHFTLKGGGETAENAAWSYEEPSTAVPQIKDHLAFYPGTAEIDVRM